MSEYHGRFAPSPTGPLHFGSLLAAVASYLDARAHQGRWSVRIEDLDPPREDPTAADSILRILDVYGLHWDGTVVRQSDRGDAYEQVLETLRQQGDAFPCACSRKQLGDRLHQGICNTLRHDDVAWRFLCPSGTLTLHDGLQEDHTYDLQRDIGDFVIRRRDTLWSYQLAVVTDDAAQGITHVVRGIDLIDSTARQYLLQQALGFTHPQYSHIPVATENNGQKLSKQNLALPLTPENAGAVLFVALQWLGQQPPTALQHASCTELLDWGTEHWTPEVLRNRREHPAPEAFRRPG